MSRNYNLLQNGFLYFRWGKSPNFESMKKIGLTGGIGSGKTFVGNILEKMGYPVYYSDQRAKIIMNTNPIIKKELLKLFGPESYNKEGIDREFLASKIFTNPELRKKINNLVHPIVRHDFQTWSEQYHDHKLLFNEAAILFETGAYKSFDAVILVCAHEDLKIERLLKRDGDTKEELRLKMKTQWTDDQKMALTPYYIINDGIRSIENQIEQVLEIIGS
tara:strand:- start:3203 stop:3859 length:657 start_codon:yes stop_codon:yes gene_type:complete